MDKLMIVNGSPRAERSNSKRYIELFLQRWKQPVEQYNVTTKKHHEACEKLEGCKHLLLVFPLYADGLPVTLMHFLKELESHPILEKPTVHVLINCGFLESEQNLVAVEMIRLFCDQNGFPFGSVLCIGSGEAILNTPFVFGVKRKLKRLVKFIRKGRTEILKTTMPISQKMFLSASTQYWLRYGEKYNVSREQMDTMEIEGQLPK